MKKLLIVLLLGLAIPQKTISGSAKFIYQQPYSIEAYILSGQTWVLGSITIMRTREGVTPINYSFDTGRANQSAIKGSFMSNDRFIPLNPNNQLAIKYNWTHSITLWSGHTAYLTLN